MGFAYCVECLIPNTRPNSFFTDGGICSACEQYKADRSIDFGIRLDQLASIVKGRLEKHDYAKTSYDCLIGVSGGKDSTRQALWVREKLGLNPLLVAVLYPPRQETALGYRNLSNLLELDFDCHVIAPSPSNARVLFREGLLRFGNAFKATEMALFSGPQRLAERLGIPILFWGENPALQVGDYATLGTTIWDGSNLLNSNTLRGGQIDWIRDALGDDLGTLPYQFPSSALKGDYAFSVYFLGPAWDDWGNVENAAFSTLRGLGLNSEGMLSGDLYRTEMLDDDFQIVNFLIKYYKFGFQRASEQASSLLRKGVIEREEAAEFAYVRDQECDEQIIENFCAYAEISVEKLWSVIREFGNSELFDFSVHPPRPRFFPGKGIITS